MKFPLGGGVFYVCYMFFRETILVNNGDKKKNPTKISIPF